MQQLQKKGYLRKSIFITGLCESLPRVKGHGEGLRQEVRDKAKDVLCIFFISDYLKNLIKAFELIFFFFWKKSGKICTSLELAALIKLFNEMVMLK